MLGAGVAERSGLFAVAMSGAMSKAPQSMLTPAVALIGMLGNLAADAAYVVLIPLAGVVFAAAGRHPIAGIAAAFAGVSGGFSANLIPGQLEPLLFGITEAAAETLDPTWNANMVGNWYFISAITFVFLPVIWYVTDKIIAPRLAPIGAGEAESSTAGIIKAPNTKLEENEIQGLRKAGLACLGIILLWIVFCIAPGTPLIEDSATGVARYNPLLQSLVAGFFILLGAEFLAIILMIVYVGALAVLFLFVVMMLNISFTGLRRGLAQYLPFGLLIGLENPIPGRVGTMTSKPSSFFPPNFSG